MILLFYLLNRIAIFLVKQTRFHGFILRFLRLDFIAINKKVNSAVFVNCTNLGTRQEKFLTYKYSIPKEFR